MQKIIRRQDYLDRIREGKDLTDVVKVVTGMRRAGKSVLLEQYADDLRSSGVDEDNILFVNFETFEYGGIDDAEKLNRLLTDRISGEDMHYVFLDEIQNVEGWERSVAFLINMRRCDIYITGSNSKMLSSELATHLSGRYVEIEVFPLSFSEYLLLYPGDRETRFSEYLRFGGLPEVDPSRGERFCVSQLTGIFNTVLIKDILFRTGGETKTLISIARYLYSNVGNITNTDMIAKALGIGNGTTDRYIGMLENAFLFHHAERYDVVGRRLLKTNGKYYCSDLGLRLYALGGGATDIGRLLKNTVYLELRRRGFTVRVGSWHDREIDFTAIRGGRTDYYQACLSMLSEEARERKLRPLTGLSDYRRKAVLTMDRIGLGSDRGTEIMNLVDWLTADDP